MYDVCFSQTKITVSDNFGDQTLPKVCFGDTSYLVGWVDNRDGTNKIYAKIVLLTGELPGEDFLVSSVSTICEPIISFDHTNNRFLIMNRAWERGYFISGDGVILGNTERVANNNEICPEALCFDGEKYFVVLYGLYGVYKNKLIGYFMSTGGEILDTVPLSSNIINPTDVNISFNGSDYLLTWLAKESLSYDVYGQIISRKGSWTTVVDKFKITDTDYDETCPRVGTDGKDWLIVWECDFQVYGKIITSDWQPDTIINIINDNYSYFPTIGYEDGMYILVASSLKDLCIGSVLRTGRLLNAEFFQQDMPIYWTDIAAKETGYLTVFSIRNEGGYDLYGITLSKNIYDFPNVVSVKVITNPFLRSARIIGYEGRIEVYDILGRVVESTCDDVFGYDLKPGIYFVRFENPFVKRGYSVIKVIKTRR